MIHYSQSYNSLSNLYMYQFMEPSMIPACQSHKNPQKIHPLGQNS